MIFLKESKFQINQMTKYDANPWGGVPFSRYVHCYLLSYLIIVVSVFYTTTV